MEMTLKSTLEEKKLQSKTSFACWLVDRIKVIKDLHSIAFLTRVWYTASFIKNSKAKSPLDTPRSRRLSTNSKSNVLFYLTGHGGENFLKFQDDEEISAKELSDAFEQMKQKERFNEFLFIIGI